MKRFFFAGITLAGLFSAGVLFAQNNNGYTDDVYYNASRAEKDAAEEAADQSAYNESAAESGQYLDDYGDYGDYGDGYIDYDDDSYTTRIRRFYYPVSGAGYWGGIYRPYWADPFYSPYGWGGWYRPGFSISFGFGSYWGSMWGWNSWYGGGYYPYYSPFYNPYYYGYGSYWSGYYAGMYDGYYYGNGFGHYHGARNYGPRGSRSNSIRSVGNYGRNSRTGTISRGARTVTPERPQSGNLSNRGQAVRREAVGSRTIRLAEPGSTRIYNNNQQAGRTAERVQPRSRQQVNRGAIRQNRDRAVAPPTHRRQAPTKVTPNRTRSSHSQRQRSYTPQRSHTPQRSYTPQRSSTPSRSFSAPSRSSSRGGSHRR